MATTVYLVSGANRGIGLGLVTALAERVDVIIFAGARKPEAATDLQALAAKLPTKVHVVKLTSADKADNEAAAAKVKEIAGRLDVVVANAGIASPSAYGLTGDVPLEGMREHFEINVLGPIALFQATYPLLKASTESPKFLVVSSELGSIAHGARVPWPVTAYGTSKAAANYTTVKMYWEYPGLIALPIHPGGVETDLTAAAASVSSDLSKIPLITVEESVKGVLKVIDEAKRDEEGPKFTAFDGKVYPW